MSITCAVSSDCTHAAVGVCEACGKPFCEAHAAPGHKHLCQNDTGWTEPGAVKMLKESAYWSARRTARDKNARDQCGVDWCQHKPAEKCISCHQSFCASHLTKISYLPGKHAEIYTAHGLPDARKGPICDSCRLNHIDIILLSPA